MDRDAVLRWMPCVVAAKLAEGVPSERAGLLEIFPLEFVGYCATSTRTDVLLHRMIDGWRSP